MTEYELELTEYEHIAWYHKHRHEHPKPHRTVDLLLGLPNTNPQENLTMAETILNTTPDETTVDGSLGSVRDLKGNVTTKDPVVSGTWSVADATLGSVVTPDTDPTGLTAVLTLLGVEGTLPVAFSGTTAAGVPVTGVASVIIAAGPPATVDLNLSVPAPVVAAPAEVPAAPATPAA